MLLRLAGAADRGVLRVFSIFYLALSSMVFFRERTHVDEKVVLPFRTFLFLQAKSYRCQMLAPLVSQRIMCGTCCSVLCVGLVTDHPLKRVHLLLIQWVLRCLRGVCASMSTWEARRGCDSFLL